MRWIETKTDEDAAVLQRRMWEIVYTEQAGAMVGTVRGEGLYEDDRFWADAIADLKGRPRERLDMASRHLPLPAAFREAAKALRASIRDSRKVGESIALPLTELHELAAIESFCVPYAEAIKQPGYNVMAMVPRGAFDRMDLSPRAVGWNELPLLNATDRKLMAATWPTPSSHTTASDAYPEEWAAYERLAVKAQRAQLEKTIADIERRVAAGDGSSVLPR